MAKRKKLRHGITKTIKGVKYKLGKTSRWERVKKNKSAFIAAGIVGVPTSIMLTREIGANIGMLKMAKGFGIKKAPILPVLGSTGSYIGLSTMAIGATIAGVAGISAHRRKKKGLNYSAQRKLIKTGLIIGGVGFGVQTLSTAGLVRHALRKARPERMMSKEGMKRFKNILSKKKISFIDTGTIGTEKIIYEKGEFLTQKIKQSRTSKIMSTLSSAYHKGAGTIAGKAKDPVLLHELTHAAQYHGPGKLKQALYGVHTLGAKTTFGGIGFGIGGRFYYKTRKRKRR
jgi:hypothetical protein